MVAVIRFLWHTFFTVVTLELVLKMVEEVVNVNVNVKVKVKVNGG